MSVLTRQTQKVFASNANVNQLAAFGTMKTGTPQYSSNLATLQTAEYTQGWSSAILDDKAPYLEEMNAVQYGLSYQIAYLLQEGVPAYDSETNYSNTSIVKVINNNELEFYHSLQNDNLGNALSNTSYWARVYFTNTGRIGEPQIALNFSSLPENCIWLEGSTVSRTTYSNLFAIYGTTYGIGNGSTTFTLPDFRNRVAWGGTSAGYISAGLPDIVCSIYNESGAIDNHIANGGTGQANYTWRASAFNSIYGNSTTVQPPAIKVRVYTRYQ